MNPYLTLAICAAIGFCSLLIQYATRSLNPISSRLGYAVFSSVVPAVFALLAPKGLRATTIRTALLYVTLFILIQLGLWIF